MPTHENDYPQLLSLAVHEFRTPAGVVGGYLRMLQRDTEHPLSSRQSKMVDEAEKSCARLVALVGELSEISNLDAGTARLAQQAVDVFALAQELAGSVHEPGDNDVQLEFRGESSGASMTGDLTRLRAAFSAILRAIVREKASACTVVTECRFDQTDGRLAVIIVAEKDAIQAAYDSKPGLFDEKRGGLGLALPIARRVIEAHGGRLWSPASVSDRDSKGMAVIAFPLAE